MPWLPAIIQATGSLGGSVASAWSANQINSDNLAFQREFAQNGVRWKVADMRAAGLNPLLSTGINATSPAGGSSVMPDFSGIGSAARDIGRLVAEKTAEKADADIDAVKAQTRNLDAQATATLANSAATVENLATSTRKMAADTLLTLANDSRQVMENKWLYNAFKNLPDLDRDRLIRLRYVPDSSASGQVFNFLQYLDETVRQVKSGRDVDAYSGRTNVHYVKRK